MLPAAGPGAPEDQRGPCAGALDALPADGRLHAQHAALVRGRRLSLRQAVLCLVGHTTADIGQVRPARQPHQEQPDQEEQRPDLRLLFK